MCVFASRSKKCIHFPWIISNTSLAFGTKTRDGHYVRNYSNLHGEETSGVNKYLGGFRIPLHNPLLDQLDQWGDVVKLRLLQDAWEQPGHATAAVSM